MLHKIDKLNEKVDSLVPAPDAREDLYRDKRIVRFYVDRIFGVIYRHRHRYAFTCEHYHRHRHHHRRHHHRRDS